jgi:hypothetical protein
MRESSATGADRRQTPRTKLAEIAYIGMGPENGGLVLDVSDGGLSFHSVAPVQAAQEIQFLLSLRGHSRIEGVGEVVWTNEMRTICGLKFISLSSGAREYLNDWTTQTKLPPAAREPRPAPRLEPASEVNSSETVAAPVFAIPPAITSPLSEPRGRAPWQDPILVWILFGVLTCGGTVIAYQYGVQVGKSEMSASARPGANPAAQPNPQTVSTAPVPAPSQPPHAAPSASDDISSVSNGVNPFPGSTLTNASKTQDASGSAAQALGSEENGSAAAAQRAEQQLQAGQSELAAAQAYLNGAPANRDSSKAVRLLWAAVGNGNAAAEVILADLYARGDGVPKSCEQGRILLVAAIKAGNIEAQQKLKDLKTRGC